MSQTLRLRVGVEGGMGVVLFAPPRVLSFFVGKTTSEARYIGRLFAGPALLLIGKALLLLSGLSLRGRLLCRREACRASRCAYPPPV